ncbi:MAG TPA: ABC transporter ATP-binding protein [Rhodopila sp.]|uniref:ABC transporter ATP-binding protein n=1 Tax=Rhodopila sp. TaxID=2480087 RepID=UPI002C581129|nr:ABC transporter ATP-binding protein [Rhodopila sp.]HVY15015.1 ABC transporter ATP-binding protein [Rhodopila sp.]
MTVLAPPLRLVDVSKSFGGVQVLKPLRLDMVQGEMLALLGPSGCGKTTTLRLIAGFEVPDTGSVVINGRDMTAMPPNKRGLGMVFQNYSLFPHMTVGENVAFGLRMRGASAAEKTKRVRAMLQMVRLESFEDRRISQLSGGQQQRIALARALATEPSILLLDEPLGALDKNLRERMQFELRDIQHRLGITCILVTHDQEEALTMSDRVAVMAHGEVKQVGHPTDVYERPRSRFVSEFLGTANIFTGTVKAQEGAAWRVAIDPRGCAEPLIAAETLQLGQRVTLAVRPEKLVLGPPKADAITARVRDIVFRGAYFAYELTLPNQEQPLFVYTQKREAVPDDGIVGLTWAPDSAVILEEPA